MVSRSSHPELRHLGALGFPSLLHMSAYAPRFFKCTLGVVQKTALATAESFLIMLVNKFTYSAQIK